MDYGSEKAYEGVCPLCSKAGVGITMDEVIEEMFQEPLPTEEEMHRAMDAFGIPDLRLSDGELLG
jgi:hypothetical protein